MSIRSQTKGFSVIELIVSVAIMVAISTMVAGNQKQFGAGATLKNIVNNMSLSLRQAQIYGVSVKEFSSGSYQAYTINSFNAGYGLHFNINTSPTGDNTAYIFFADRKPSSPPSALPNGMYASGMSCPTDSTSECLEKIVLSQGHTVSDICTTSGGVDDCSPNTLDVTFVRPAVEAKIIFNQNGVLRDVACIEISSQEGKRNSVVVYTTGQISVKQLACTDAI